MKPRHRVDVRFVIEADTPEEAKEQVLWWMEEHVFNRVEEDFPEEFASVQVVLTEGAGLDSIGG